MECKQLWSSDFLATSFPLLFRNGPLRKHRRQVLYEREKALLPSMQVFAQAKREINHLEKQLKIMNEGENLASLRSAIATIKKMGREAMDEWVRLKLARESLQEKRDADPLSVTEEEMDSAKEAVWLQWAAVAAWFKKRRQASKLYGRANLQLKYIRHQLFRQRHIYNGEGGRTVRTQFLMKCGQEDCRGFLSTVYKCGTCANWTCPDCLVVLGPEREVEHTCAPDQVATAKAIQEDTRPCPKCGTRIYKIDGCDQMWCVMEHCNTAFSWASGQVVTGRVHNPHYYEWVRRTGGGVVTREIGDIPCGGLPTAEELWHAIRNERELSDSELLSVSESLFRINVHITELIGVYIQGFPARPPQGMNKDVNVAYLLNEIDDAAWKRSLEMNETKFVRKREIGQILHMLSTTVADTMRDFCEMGRQLRDWDTFCNWYNTSFLPDLNRLRNYTNEALRDLSLKHHMAVPQFGEAFQWLGVRALYTKKAKEATYSATSAAGGSPNIPLPQ